MAVLFIFQRYNQRDDDDDKINDYNRKKIYKLESNLIKTPVPYNTSYNYRGFFFFSGKKIDDYDHRFILTDIYRTWKKILKEIFSIIVEDDYDHDDDQILNWWMKN